VNLYSTYHCNPISNQVENKKNKFVSQMRLLTWDNKGLFAREHRGGWDNCETVGLDSYDLLDRGFYKMSGNYCFET
jgi:hypothetical protein